MSPETGTVRHFEGDHSSDGLLSPDNRLLMFDSYRIDNGMVLGWELHERRFLANFEQQTDRDPGDAIRFLRWVRLQLKDFSGFPRLEVVKSAERLFFQLRLRPLGTWRPIVKLAVGELGDPRKSPEVKGYDFDQNQLLGQQAQMAGADEYLVRSDDGHVIETNCSAIVWFDGPVLCYVSRNLRRLSSVTEEMLLQRARDNNIECRSCTITYKHLSKKSVYVLNSRSLVRPALVSGTIDP